MFGKGIRNTTTIAGQILWSDNSKRLSYIRNLSAGVYRPAVREQFYRAQFQFDHLLLLQPDEDRQEPGLHFDLRDIVDNVAEKKTRSNFVSQGRGQFLTTDQVRC